MTELKSWKIIKSGNLPETLLAVDFPQLGRSEAGFIHLAPLLEPEYPVWHTVPPLVGAGSEVTGADYVDRWAREVRESGVLVRGVLGYCTGAVYGAALAERVANWQDAPRLLLFDPEPTTMDTVYREFSTIIRNLSSVLDETEVAELLERAPELRKAQRNVTGFAEAMFRVIEPVALAGFGRCGLDPTRSQELLDVLAAFIAYLTKAEELAWQQAWSGAMAISSTSELSGLNLYRMTHGDTSGIVGSERHAGVDHDNLLRSLHVAEEVVNLLRGNGAEGRTKRG